ncbi:zinc finger protein 227 isoform X2 [Bombyx mori]|uniref:Uncharacterized protein n=1 Tax=Bombyx mori TaxID=7091 RepID=A0A8R2C749_BOMMO|nr:zinc finger protein 227 isoform X2 [Bombyx mori]
MRCCVTGCKNDSRNLSKSQGITFHVFPSEPSLRAAWLQVLCKDGWEPKERSAVCSKHFLAENLYETQSGLRKVKAGAVPFLETTMSCTFRGTETLKACRICLLTCGRFYSLQTEELRQAYENLTGIQVTEDDGLPVHLCPECSVRLLNGDRFRRRALRANSLLLGVLRSDYVLTTDSINRIDRAAEKLTSNLTCDVTHCDADPGLAAPSCRVYLQDDAELEPEETKYDVQGGDVTADVDTQEYVIVKSDQVDDGFSSDDNLPLEAAKLKVKQEKVKKKPKKESKEPKVDRRRKPFMNAELSDTLFTTTQLSVEEQVAEIHKRKEGSNYRNGVFKCDECFKGFQDADAYSSHMTRHTDQCGDHQCLVCRIYFRNQHALRKHMTAHHSSRFSCKQCPFVTNHRQTARLHERWHCGTKYRCPHCPEEFVKFTTYMGHLRIKHPSDFVCELCGYCFVSAKGIMLHKQLKHRLEDGKVPEKGPYCEQCDVRFVSPDAYDRHMIVSAKHSTDTKRAANKAKSRRPNDAAPRARRPPPAPGAKPDGPIPCEQCGLQLDDPRAYHKHFRRMHPDKNRTNYPSMKTPCMCEVCGRMFQSQALLNDHRWVHTGEKPFKCEVCDKTFRMRQRLMTHRRVHSRDRASYGCALCGKHFSSQSNRQRHMFIHTGLKPYKCEMCGKGFKHTSEKRAHITYVHLKKPWPKRSRSKRRTDNRTATLQATDPPELDMGQPIWPNCEQKLNEMNLIEDKPMYYNIKI